MTLHEIAHLPDIRRCEQARLNRDARFDGVFFFAVTRARVYCRPVCPLATDKNAQVRYYRSAAAAECDGYRPCSQCRPELAPRVGWGRGDAPVARAMRLIEQEFHGVDNLARQVGVGSSQLRRLFMQQVGAPPHRVRLSRRLLAARQLLLDTPLPLKRIANLLDFNSLRHLNKIFTEAYHVRPEALRQTPGKTRKGRYSLRLNYRPPFPFHTLLDYLRDRSLHYVEVVSEDSYTRSLGPRESPGWLRVTQAPDGEPALHLELYCPNPRLLLDTIQRVRRMFDLDAEPRLVDPVLSTDRELLALVEQQPGLRLPGAWDGFELAMYRMTRQFYHRALSRDIMRKLVETCGTPLTASPAYGVSSLFPAPEEITTAVLKALGISTEATRALIGIVDAIGNGDIDFRDDLPLEETLARWQALPAVDMRAAHYIALRALGHPDAFPALVAQHFKHLSPWRGYAWMHLKEFGSY